MDCEKCGARLELPEDGSTVVRCQYCGNETRIGPVKPLPRRIRPTPTAPLRIPAPSSRKNVAGCVVTAIAVVGGVVAAGIAITTGAIRRGSATDLLGASLHWQSPACLVDANGDGVLDVGGLSGPRSEQVTPTIVDGATGKVLWQGKEPRGHLGRLLPEHAVVRDP